MKDIIIFGASGHGSSVLDCIEKEGKYKVAGFLDSFKKKGSKHNGYPILGSEYELPFLINKYNLREGIVAVGDNWSRSILVKKITKIVPDFNFISSIHPNTVIGNNVTIGSGVVIMPGVIINSNSTIGNHCILNTLSSLDHDGNMHEFSSLAPGVCTGGNFELGGYSAICLGAQIIENIKIGEHTVVGAGALVLNNLGSHLLSYGSPSKIIRNRSIGESYLSLNRKTLKSAISSTHYNQIFRVK
ncbi:acetyltransferase [Eudoraea adriatica]|uniref:acetyltransferase n=1 Tax=Eudoraea adriatica TaxID=446681 RepID=UPI00037D0F40|nr:acetyltransferase [Eudoraea adriatica]